jgi:hypothetical protein
MIGNSQADSAGSIPVTRSTTKAKSGNVPDPAFIRWCHFWQLTCPLRARTVPPDLLAEAGGYVLVPFFGGVLVDQRGSGGGVSHPGHEVGLHPITGSASSSP